MSANNADLDALLAAVETAGLGPLLTPPPAEINVEDDELAGLAELEALTVEGGGEMSRPVEVQVEETAEAIEEPVVETLTDEALNELADEISHEETKQAIYAEADAGTEIVETAEPTKTKKARTASTGLTPRKARYGSGTAGDYVAAVIGDAEIKVIVDALPKKVKDKAANLVEHVRHGKALSVYTQTAVGLLKTERKLVSATLVAAYQAQSKRNGGEGYSIGTARSQAGQQSALLKGFGVIAADGTLVEGNKFAEALGL